MVDRGTARADELSTDDLVEGGRALRAKVTRVEPRWLAVLGVVAYRAAFASPHAAVGPQADPIGATSVWVLPNPSGLNAHYTLDRLVAEFARLRDAVTLSPPR